MNNSIPQNKALIPQKGISEQYWKRARTIAEKRNLLRNSVIFSEIAEIISLSGNWNLIPQNEALFPQKRNKSDIKKHMFRGVVYT